MTEYMNIQFKTWQHSDTLLTLYFSIIRYIEHGKLKISFTEGIYLENVKCYL